MTVYESAITKRPRLRLLRALKRHLDLLLNSGSLMGATLVTSILGFAYWWVAARAFTPETVGTASAIVSTLTLVGTLSVFGMGTLLISELSGLPGREWNFIGACMLASSIAATAGGLIYIVLARFVITGLRRSVGSAPTTILLLVGVVVTATTLVLDDGLLGLLAGPKQLLRNTYFAVLKLVGLGVLALLPITVHPGHVLATWVGGGVLSVVLLWGALRKQGLRGIPLPQLSLLRGRLGQAVEHNILNVALFVPRTVLPLVVTAVLSPTATAAFYTAYMMVSFVTMVPNHLATTLFAATAGNMVALRAKIRMALLVSVGIGVPACLGLAVLAHPVMQLFGHAYAQHASTALTIMALAYPAMIFRPLYVAASRVAGRVRRASVFAIVAGACEVGGASYGASRGSLTDLAVWLAGAFVLEGLLTAPTVLSLALRRPNAFSHARGGWRSSRRLRAAAAAQAPAPAPPPQMAPPQMAPPRMAPPRVPPPRVPLPRVPPPRVPPPRKAPVAAPRGTLWISSSRSGSGPAPIPAPRTGQAPPQAENTRHGRENA